MVRPFGQTCRSMSGAPSRIVAMRDGLLAEAEWIRVEATLGLSADIQVSRGQYFTPEQAAALIASLPTVRL